MSNKSSSNSKKHPYLIAKNWVDKLNFWEGNPLYSQRSKDYFNECVNRWSAEEKALTRV